MLLRTRVTLIVTVTYSLLAVGLTFAGLKSEELADQRFAQATMTGQKIFWGKLIENTIQRLETAAPILLTHHGLVEAVSARNPSRVREAMDSLAEELRVRPWVARIEIVGPEGGVLYSSAGSLIESAQVDAGVLGLVAADGRARSGILQSDDGRFIAVQTVPLTAGNGRMVGIITLISDLRPPLAEFKASTGAEVFLVDRTGRMTDGTDSRLWSLFDGRLSVRKSRLETVRDGNRFLSVVVFPLDDGQGRVIGALVSVRDSTETQQRQTQIREVAIAAVAGFLVLVLGLVWVYLRRSFDPLDQAITVLNALSRGDTSVAPESSTGNDEIGRIAAAVAVFRENVVRLDQMEARRQRQRRRQELFIRLQMRSLSEMLEREAREAVLEDLHQIELLSARPSGSANGADDSGKGELDVLAVAFETMTARIREQHDRLEALIALRTRDVEILREALRTRDQLAALRQELDFARELQLSSLPRDFPPFPERDDFTIFAQMVPAKEVGGDFYDFFLIDGNRLGFVIGDASGKGVPAAMFIAITRSLVKAVAPLSASPGECLAFVNTMLARDNPQTLFATCFYAILDTRDGSVAFCNAGHPPPLILRRDGAVEAIRDVSGVALGVMEGLEYDTGSFVLTPGESVLIYTDGVTEAQDGEERLYGEDTLIAAVAEIGAAAVPETVVAEVVRGVDAFVGAAPQFDDITLLTLRFERCSSGQAAALVPMPRLLPVAPADPVDAAEEKGDDSSVSTGTRREIVIANDLSELERLAGIVQSFIAGLGLPETFAFNINLCLDELITNTISYGYGDKLRHDIHVALEYDGTHFVTELSDDGREYDPFVEAPAPDLTLDVEERPIGGLGVFLVKELMDVTEYRRESDRNIITLRKIVGEQEN